jgi:maleylacetate reductase
LANAIVLPGAMAFNAEAVPEALGALAAALDVDDAVVAVTALVERLGLPTRLGEVGVTDDDLEAVARLSQSNGSVRANPRPVSEADARAVLDSVF